MLRQRAMYISLVIVTAALLLPGVASAQTGTIAGSVKDTTGAVLPGVTVEAASPALIEKVRTAVTAGQVGGSLGHPAASATRTESAALAGKRDEPVEAAVAAAKPREAAGEPSTLKEIPNSCSTKRGRPSPSRKLAACARKVSK